MAVESLPGCSRDPIRPAAGINRSRPGQDERKNPTRPDHRVKRDALLETGRSSPGPGPEADAVTCNIRLRHNHARNITHLTGPKVLLLAAIRDGDHILGRLTFFFL
jgi:hypothetical protein